MKDGILEIRPLGSVDGRGSRGPSGGPWACADPFLFCVHHDDKYPAGNDRMGPDAPFTGRDIGQDFAGIDGWRMYHGAIVPGFPQHPHRGFETVTIVRTGLIDHSDSLGATARFGRGDTQWLTAGGGIVHAEMFPLVNKTAPNPLELFQIWLNLPAEDKMVAPHFAMLWNDQTPRCSFDSSGAKTEVTVVAGSLHDGEGDKKAPPPPPHSWASRPDADVAIWCIKMDSGAKWTLPKAASAKTSRTLYFFKGPSMHVSGELVAQHAAVTLRGDRDIDLAAGEGECEMLLLQGRPIAEPVVQYGPFVMNTRQEIEKAMTDYRKTGFGGWPWPSDDPVHPREEGRFAKHADGRIERAE